MLNPDPNPNPKSISGLLDKDCSPSEILALAAKDVTALAAHHMDNLPKIVFITKDNNTLPFISSILYAAGFEILKNAMRATCEGHRGVDPHEVMPPIKVMVADSVNGEVLIKISDRGGGVPDKNIPHLDAYAFSTCSTRVWTSQGGRVRRRPRYWESIANTQVGHDLKPGSLARWKEQPLHLPHVGFSNGHGLPISKLWLEAFGSGIELISLPGVGVDAYIRLKGLDDDATPVAL